MGGAGGLGALEGLRRGPADWTAGWLEPDLNGRSGDGAGDRRRAAETAVLGMVQAAAGRLHMRQRPGGVVGVLVEQQAVQAGQTGPRRQENQQQEERLGPDQSCGHGIIIAEIVILSVAKDPANPLNSPTRGVAKSYSERSFASLRMTVR